MMNIPIVPPADQEIIIVGIVRVGDVIKSPAFANVLFRDVKDLDPMLGFNVNPYTYYKHWDNTRNEILQDLGLIINKSKSAPQSERYKDYKLTIDANRCYIVIFTYRATQYEKEYFDEDDRTGRYPLGVVAKMLGPEGEFDPYGLEIWFHMQAGNPHVKHVVNEVQLITYFDITLNHETIYDTED